MKSSTDSPCKSHCTSHPSPSSSVRSWSKIKRSVMDVGTAMAADAETLFSQARLCFKTSPLEARHLSRLHPVPRVLQHLSETRLG